MVGLDLGHRAVKEGAKLGRLGLPLNGLPVLCFTVVTLIGSPNILVNETIYTEHTLECPIASDSQRSRASKKPGRNELCHCGSGRKHERCHGSNRGPQDSRVKPVGHHPVESRLRTSSTRFGLGGSSGASHHRQLRHRPPSGDWSVQNDRWHVADMETDG